MLASKAGQHTGGQPIEDDGFFDGDGEIDPDDSKPPEPIEPINPVDPVDPPPPDTEPPEPPPTPDVYDLQYSITCPSTWVRGEQYQLEIIVRSSSGQVNASGSGLLALLDRTDPDDKLYRDETIILNSIYIDQGKFYYNMVSINDGSGDQTAMLQISGGLSYNSHFTPVEPATQVIDIVDALSSLLWVSHPLSVERGVAFTIALSGGPESDSLPIQLKSSDSFDTLVAASVVPPTSLTELEFDEDGNASLLVMIVGGSFDANGVIEIIDQNGKPVACPEFPITGIAMQTSEDELTLEDTFQGALLEIEIEVLDDGEFIDTTFSLRVRVLDDLGGVDTSFNGLVELRVTSENGEPTMVDFGSDATITGDYSCLITITDGIWAYTSCVMDAIISDGETCIEVEYSEDTDPDATDFMSDTVCQDLSGALIKIDATEPLVSIAHDPSPDDYGDTSPDYTPFERSFKSASLPVEITAPASANSKDFIGWTKDGVPFSSDNPLTISEPGLFNIGASYSSISVCGSLYGGSASTSYLDYRHEPEWSLGEVQDSWATNIVPNHPSTSFGASGGYGTRTQKYFDRYYYSHRYRYLLSLDAGYSSYNLSSYLGEYLIGASFSFSGDTFLPVYLYTQMTDNPVADTVQSVQTGWNLSASITSPGNYFVPIQQTVQQYLRVIIILQSWEFPASEDVYYLSQISHTAYLSLA